MFEFKLNKPLEQIARDSGINSVSAFFAANQARKLMHEYIPRDTGALAGTAQVTAENTTGTVHYNQPYARFCYYGDRKVFRRDKHEKATAYWDTVMILSHRESLIESVSNFIKGK